MTQNLVGNKILEKQGVAWRSSKGRYLITRFVGNSLRLLWFYVLFCFVCLPSDFFKVNFVGLALFCLGGEVQCKSWPLWVGQSSTFAGRKPLLLLLYVLAPS